ncbi:MAG: OmpH family outer membrane protein [Chromatiales bacterium]|jgi:outer membrane protein|nr:OmpH family outer membrane protein [Chromatiales bacterium]MDX9766143.1 OmpH family outer membrane protein [Ectothiorhodospiraceae bacterium]
MRLIKTLLLSLLLASLSTAVAAETKIGFVNINRLIEQAPQAEAASKGLEREFSPRNAELTTERDALRQMQQRLERDGDVMPADKRADLERDFRNRSREFKRAQEMFTEDLNARRNEEIAKVQRLIFNAILELAEQEQYDLIVTESVLFASTRIDLTPRILERLKQMQANNANASGRTGR